MDASDSLNVVAVPSTPNTIITTINDGETWTTKAFPFNQPTDVSITDAAHFWIATEDGEILVTSDSGSSWILQYSDPNATNFMNYVKMFDVKNGIAMGDALLEQAGPALFLKTTDGGAHWNSMNTSYLIGVWSGDMWRRLSFISANEGYFFESGINPQELLKTTDGGANWSYAGFTGYMQVLKFYDENIGIGYNSLDTATKVYRTTNGGSTWEHFVITGTTGLGGNDIEFLPKDPAKVWLATYDKLFFSGDTGRDWKEQSVVAGTLMARAVVCTDDHHAWLMSDNSIIYRTEHADGVTSKVERNQAIQVTFRLLQNFPNPFNPTTVINYQLPVNGFVSLKVYDVLGREVKTLVNEHQTAGSRSITFNAAALPSGVYFYRLQAGSYNKTMKLLLLK